MIQIIDIGGVHIDGRRIRRASLSLTSGQKIELHTDNLPLTPFRLSSAEIVWRDRSLIIINKPAAVLTQPTPARIKGTLYEALQHLLKREGIRQPQIGMHQRLDVGTTGLLAFSIDKRAHKALAHQVADRSLHRTYLAVVHGTPQRRGTLRSRLARRHRDNRTVSVTRGGREAITHYEVVDQRSNIALLRIRLETGRSHQIRAHLSEAGHPLPGDTFYGGSADCNGFRLHRPCLHSAELTLRHPIDRRRLHFSAPLPADMLQLLK